MFVRLRLSSRPCQSRSAGLYTLYTAYCILYTKISNIYIYIYIHIYRGGLASSTISILVCSILVYPLIICSILVLVCSIISILLCIFISITP